MLFCDCDYMHTLILDLHFQYTTCETHYLHIISLLYHTYLYIYNVWYPPSTTSQTCRSIAIHNVWLQVLQICINALFDVLLRIIVEHVFKVLKQEGYHTYTYVGTCIQTYIHTDKWAKSESRNILIGTMSQLLKDLQSSHHAESLLRDLASWDNVPAGLNVANPHITHHNSSHNFYDFQQVPIVSHRFP